jgi:CBS domain-containing protein
MDSLMARDVMSSEVRAVCEDTPLEEIAALLATHHISGVPVVDEEQRVIGIVSEADLIDEHKRERHIPRVALYGLFPIPEDLLAAAYAGGKGLTARDMMTRKVTTASEKTSCAELADLMVRRHINRVPIVRDGKLVGIVCRDDLVRALALDGG